MEPSHRAQVMGQGLALACFELRREPVKRLLAVFRTFSSAIFRRLLTYMRRRATFRSLGQIVLTAHLLERMPWNYREMLSESLPARLECDESGGATNKLLSPPRSFRKEQLAVSYTGSAIFAATGTHRSANVIVVEAEKIDTVGNLHLRGLIDDHSSTTEKTFIYAVVSVERG